MSCIFSLLSGPLLIFYAFSFQVITVPFPFQSLMKLLLLCMTSGLLLYASPGIVATFLPHPLQTDQLFLTLLSTMGVSVLIPMLFRLVTLPLLASANQKEVDHDFRTIRVIMLLCTL